MRQAQPVRHLDFVVENPAYYSLYIQIKKHQKEDNLHLHLLQSCNLRISVSVTHQLCSHLSS